MGTDPQYVFASKLLDAASVWGDDDSDPRGMLSGLAVLPVTVTKDAHGGVASVELTDYIAGALLACIALTGDPDTRDALMFDARVRLGQLHPSGIGGISDV